MKSISNLGYSSLIVLVKSPSLNAYLIFVDAIQPN